MIAALTWAAECALESSGAIFAWRKRLWLLFSLLAFRASADVLTFVVARELGRNAYGIAWWACRAVQYILLCALVCQICRELLREHKPIFAHAGAMVALGSAVAAWFFYRGETLAHRFLDAEISASMFLGVMIIVGWISRRGSLDRLWAGITAGFVVSVTGDALCAFLWTFWEPARHFYPIGALIALGLWNWTAWKPFRLAEFRPEIPKKFQPTSVSLPQMRSRMIN